MAKKQGIFMNEQGPWGQGPKKPSRPAGSNSNEELEKALEEFQRKMQRFFRGGGDKGGDSGNSKGANFFFLLIISVIAAIWLLQGIFKVDAKEEAIILRFGEYNRTAGPGLRFHFPYPIETREVFLVKERYVTQIGDRGEKTALEKKGFRVSVPTRNREILMLTGDENIVDVSFEVQWQIADSKQFAFNVKNPELTVRDAAESAMREIVGTTPINDVLSEKRTTVQSKTKELLQKILDDYNAGINVEEINLKGVPPASSITIEDIRIDDDGNPHTARINTTVDEAFKDVQAAKINKEETINKALAYRNEVIPIARGQAQEALQKAQGYKERVVSEAEGEASRFNSVYEQYRKAPVVTKKRMYLETMEEVLSNMDKIILDASGTNGVIPYLPLNNIEKK